jgi:16S rRNA (adenine1518-N6/adenine1519-N6)-dimethyltransferase
MPQTLTEIKALLAARSIHPRKRFGQNFLIDHNKLRQIIASAKLSADDIVLEVGPGTGTLTESLLRSGARVVAVEIDRDMATILRDRFGDDNDRWRLLDVDVLSGKHAIDARVIEALTAMGGAAGGDPAAHRSLPLFRLIANLPYNIASPLLATLATDYPQMNGAVVMVQREVADRIGAGPGSKDYGPLTVMVQATCQVRRITTLPPHCFWPRPAIESAVLRLDRRAAPATRDLAALHRLVQRLFGQRRKQVGSILGRDTPLPDGIDPSARPEQLSVAQLARLAESVG